MTVIMVINAISGLISLRTALGTSVVGFQFTTVLERKICSRVSTEKCVVFSKHKLLAKMPCSGYCIWSVFL